MNTLHLVEKLERIGDAPFANMQGNQMIRAFWPSERYVVDFAEDFKLEGWQQFDTDQDAHYFGVWVNPAKRLTLCYAEGDWTLVKCADRDSYNAEIQAALDFYGEGFEFKVVDVETGQVTEVRQDRSGFII